MIFADAIDEKAAKQYTVEIEDRKRQAEQILEWLEGAHRIGFRTRELVISSIVTGATCWRYRSRHPPSWTGARMNRLIYGGDLLARDNARFSMQKRLT